MLFRCTAVVALVGFTSLAGAQAPPSTVGLGDESLARPAVPPLTAPASQLRLTTAQKAAILDAIRRGGKASSPVDFATTAGAPVPPSIELYNLPDSALAEVPEAKILKYTRVHDEVVLVDPTTMRVVEALPQSGP
jgi:Protein of unknown function (DUF1236)